MIASAVLAGYQVRLQELMASASRVQSARLVAMGIIGLAVMLISVLATTALTRHSFSLWNAVLPVPIGLYYARDYRRRGNSLNRLLRLQRFYEAGVARLQDDWAGKGVGGKQFAQDDHPYQHDLNLFGDGSLFELLCTCRTEIGRQSLAQALLEGGATDLQERQEAVRELQSRVDLREQLGSLGEFSFQDCSTNTFSEWLTLPHTPARRWLSVLLLITSLSTALSFVLLYGALFLLTPLSVLIASLLVVHFIIGLVYRDRLRAWLPATRLVGLELRVLREGIELVSKQQFQSAKLQRLTGLLCQQRPIRPIRKLERLTNALAERDREWCYFLSRGLILGTQLFLAIERWRVKHGQTLADCVAAWGEFESLMALAGYAYEHPGHCWPRLLPERTALEAEALGHPLLPASDCIRNDFSLNGQTNFYVLSGSNMAGKSTLLRAIGINAVLAYAGAPVCARSFALSEFSVCASLAIVDSLQHGRSKFLSEIDRLRRMIALSGEDRPVLFLIDEILSGTNSRDRRVAAEAILRTLVGNGAVGVLSTHDLALTELPALDRLRGANIHMGSEDPSDPMSFDYRVKAGITGETNALAIARLAGVRI